MSLRRKSYHSVTYKAASVIATALLSVNLGERIAVGLILVPTRKYSGPGSRGKVAHDGCVSSRGSEVLGGGAR